MQRERFERLSEVIDHITPAFGDHADDFDIEAIARETHTWDVPTGENGWKDGRTEGYVLAVSDSEFWEIAAKHDKS